MNLAFSSILFGAALSLAACGSRMAAGPQPQHDPAPMVSSAPTIPPGIVSDAGNPPAAGFNAEGSDSRAIELADRVMARLGGRAAWDETRYLTWRFFGGRRHVWDKWTGDHRLEDGELIVLSNLHDHHGRAWRSGEEILDPDSLAVVLDKAYANWINDSYWLVMPYKLKDSGVTLTLSYSHVR